MAATTWFFEIVHATSFEKQQEVLELFHGVTGVRAFGVSGGLYYVVGFWCDDQKVKTAAEALLAEIDPGAVCVYDSGALRAAK